MWTDIFLKVDSCNIKVYYFPQQEEKKVREEKFVFYYVTWRLIFFLRLISVILFSCEDKIREKKKL